MRCMVLMWKYRIVVSIELAFTDIVIGDGDDDERLPFEKIRISNSIAFQNGIKIFSIISTSAPNRFLIRGSQFVIRRTKSPATLFHRTRQSMSVALTRVFEACSSCYTRDRCRRKKQIYCIYQQISIIFFPSYFAVHFVFHLGVLGLSWFVCTTNRHDKSISNGQFNLLLGADNTFFKHLLSIIVVVLANLDVFFLFVISTLLIWLFAMIFVHDQSLAYFLEVHFSYLSRSIHRRQDWRSIQAIEMAVSVIV